MPQLFSSSQIVVKLAVFGVLVVFVPGCVPRTPQASWSSQRAWTYVKRTMDTSGDRDLAKSNPDLLRTKRQRRSELQQQIKSGRSRQMPEGWPRDMLDELRNPVANALREEETYLPPGQTGLIMLGELTGADGRSLLKQPEGKLAVVGFMNTLLRDEQLGDRWIFMAMTVKEARKLLVDIGGDGGQAIKHGGREFFYSPESVVVLDLVLAARQDNVAHTLQCRGAANLASLATRTSRGTEEQALQYHYQPLAGRWILASEEQRRIDAEVKAREETKASNPLGFAF